MDELLHLLDDLVEALERRDGSEPDFGQWEADRDVRRLERQLVAEYRIASNDLARIDAAVDRPAFLVASR